MLAVGQLLSGGLSQLSLDELWNEIGAGYAINEMALISQLLPLTELDNAGQQRCRDRAARWVRTIRSNPQQGWSIEPLLQEFSLDTREGIALMTLAEALIRVPDSYSADALIEDRLRSAEWKSGAEKQSALWLNMSSWALSQARQWYGEHTEERAGIGQLVRKLGEPVLRTALQQAMATLAGRFVMGETIFDALDRAGDDTGPCRSYSFDMLGEAAVCAADAERYLDAYLKAIRAIGRNESQPADSPAPGISIKLSALHPRFEALKGEEMLTELQVAMAVLITEARQLDVAITIDAEEADRLEPTLQLFRRLYQGPAHGWGRLGLAVQAYSKRALPTLCWLNRLASEQQDEIPIRLVKGAYWDTEIKLAQQRGQSDYPVFSRKAATDISYLACARYLLSEQTALLLPQFATHNAQTLSQILSYSETCGSDAGAFECQRLHGMGEALYDCYQLEGGTGDRPPLCRIYAPVGSHRELLPYLVRRMLENGANSSFVSRIMDPVVSVATLTEAPQQLWESDPTPGLPLPGDLFAPRINSRGLNLQISSQRQPLQESQQLYAETLKIAAPIINGELLLQGRPARQFSPQDRRRLVGELYSADAEQVEPALTRVSSCLSSWQRHPVELRAGLLERFSDLLESHAAELISLCIHEAGKTWQDSLDELREATDFCRYYASRARELMATPRQLPSVTGEQNLLSLQPRGIFLCISPWNFPLAIFVGQIAAALVTGNGVIAKPARQTSLIASRCCQLLLDAGLPPGILALLPGPSENFTDLLLSDRRIQGVAFTGSNATAHYINRQLALRDNCPMAAMVAETGGQNAMIADSTALAEQVVRDALTSAFGSTGQRCSALRVLYLQEEIADDLIELLTGAMNQLQIGDPEALETDIGPVIDRDAERSLQEHIETMGRQQRILHQLPLPAGLKQGNWVAPTLIRLNSIRELSGEHFGPVLHVIRYPADRLMHIVDEINSSGYGLTLAIHSRNESDIRRIADRARVGNIYINRNQTGAVVEAQPFGGQGLSGTGPKAGGPNYLMRFVCEKTETTNTTAWGGNVRLLNSGQQR